MMHITIDGDRLRIKLDGWDRLWSLKGGLDIPLAQIERVTVAPTKLRPRGLRAPGAALPGVIYAGTWRGRGFKEFWNVRRTAANRIQLELNGHDFARVVLELPDPAALAAKIEAARR
jgi:hypothetical protein